MDRSLFLHFHDFDFGILKGWLEIDETNVMK